jgi:hypothetical protein
MTQRDTYNYMNDKEILMFPSGMKVRARLGRP